MTSSDLIGSVVDSQGSAPGPRPRREAPPGPIWPVGEKRVDGAGVKAAGLSFPAAVGPDPGLREHKAAPLCGFSL